MNFESTKYFIDAILTFHVPYFKVNRTSFLFRVALLEDVNSIAAETDCQAGFISKGISMACFYYARCLHEGRGVQKDEVESKSFYTKVRQLFIAFVIYTLFPRTRFKIPYYSTFPFRVANSTERCALGYRTVSKKGKYDL